MPLTPDDLRSFETEIADLFNAAKIPYPVHLSDGNEEALIAIFEDVGPKDWVCCTWRSHYHCLLKGVPPEELKQAIMEGHSIALNFPEYRIVSSAIAGGTIPIALGIALGIKRDGDEEKVHCFVGDMMAESGIFHECQKYACHFGLPLRLYVEDNGLSVCTDTRAVWNSPTAGHVPLLREPYRYSSKYPHAGAGKRVQF